MVDTHKETINGKNGKDPFEFLKGYGCTHVGEQIGILRISFNKSEADMAKAIGIEEEEYKRWEKMPDIDDETLVRIVKAFGLPIEFVDFLKKSVGKPGNNYLNLGEANNSNNYIGNMNVFIQSDKDLVGLFLDFIKTMFQDNKELSQQQNTYFKEIMEKIQNG